MSSIQSDYIYIKLPHTYVNERAQNKITAVTSKLKKLEEITRDVKSIKGDIKKITVSVEDLLSTDTKTNQLNDLFRKEVQKKDRDKDRLQALIEEGADLRILVQEKFKLNRGNGIPDDSFVKFLATLISHQAIAPEDYAKISLIAWPSILRSITDITALKRIEREFNSFWRVDPLAHLVYEYFDETNFEFYKSIIEKGYPITNSFISHAFQSMNFKFIYYIFENISEKTPLCFSFYEVVEDLKDSYTAELFMKKKLINPNNYNELLNSVFRGEEWLVKWMLTNGNYKDSDIEKLIPYALRNQNFDMVRELCNHSKNIRYSETFNLYNITGEKGLFVRNVKGHEALTNKEMDSMLFNMALHTSISEIYEICQIFPEFYEVLPDVLAKISVVVRFPKDVGPTFINEQQKKGIYNRETEKYASANLAFIREMLPNVTNYSRKKLLKFTFEERLSRPDMLKKDKETRRLYSTFRIDDDEQIHHCTAIFHRTVENETRIDSLSKSYEYWLSLRHFHNFLFDPNKVEWKKDLSPFMEFSKNRVTYYYSFGKQKVPMTILELNEKEILISDDGKVNDYPIKWRHTSQQSLKDLSKHIEDDIHQGLLHFVGDQTDPDIKEEFNRLMATDYWLGTSCDTHRGTPHNVMIRLALLNEHLARPWLIPKKEYFFADNAMLMLPIDYVQKNWNTFWEQTFDEWVQNNATIQNKDEYLAKVFKINGMMLQGCSDKVRANKDLVKIAVEQNAKAIRFASESVKNSLKEDEEVFGDEEKLGDEEEFIV